MRRKNSCYLRSLSLALSPSPPLSLSLSLSAAAKLAFWQWNANVAGKVELPSSVSQFLSLSSQLLVLLLLFFPFPTPPCCGLCRRLVIDLNFMCTQQQQQQQKKWISTALFVRPDSTSLSYLHPPKVLLLALHSSATLLASACCPLPAQVVGLGQLWDAVTLSQDNPRQHTSLCQLISLIFISLFLSSSFVSSCSSACPKILVQSIVKDIKPMQLQLCFFLN